MIATHEDSDETGYCRGCGTTIGEHHHNDCDVPDQIEMMSETELRTELRIVLRELESKSKRLLKIEGAALRVVQQTTAERAYALHDELIAALDQGEALPIDKLEKRL